MAPSPGESANSGEQVPCDTFARAIVRLSAEIRQLTREIPLREGHLLELENQSAPDDATLRRFADEIRSERRRREIAEHDLVVLEVLLRQNCVSVQE